MVQFLLFINNVFLQKAHPVIEPALQHTISYGGTTRSTFVNLLSKLIS